jgi:hypothetical protein
VSPPNSVDGVLIQWGDRLFYPGNRIVKTPPESRLGGFAGRPAFDVRQRIEAIVLRRAQQVMVKVTGGGRGMKAIAAHLRYISKNGRLQIEDERGNKLQGKESLLDLADEWRFGGGRIGDTSDRREAFNIMLSMPRGTDPLTVLNAARDFAKAELGDHKYVMVLHDHQANPHVHLSVRAESRHGKRLNPRKADLHRWRETFAEKLRERGIDAEATRQATRGVARSYEPLWRLRAREEGRLRVRRPQTTASARALNHRQQVGLAWGHIANALSQSAEPSDRRLAEAIVLYARDLREARERPKAVRSDAGIRRQEQVGAPTIDREQPGPQR